MAPRSKKKPLWIVEKERSRRSGAAETVWLFGIHAVRDALANPLRERLRLIVTKNAFDKLETEITASGMEFELVEPRNFKAPIDPQSVHQGAALEVKPLDWGDLSSTCAPRKEKAPRVVLLDRVTDPHNVGAILRSAEVFGARAVIGTQRNSAPETGALAKTASGALERQPYLRIRNLATAMKALREMGYYIVGMDGTATSSVEDAVMIHGNGPMALVMGAEGPGLRDITKDTCDELVKIDFAADFGSLNVSNACAVALYAACKDKNR